MKLWWLRRKKRSYSKAGIKHFLATYIFMLSCKTIHFHNKKNNAGFQKLWVCKSDSIAMTSFAYWIENRRGN